jgi:hypothetical protein
LPCSIFQRDPESGSKPFLNKLYMCTTGLGYKKGFDPLGYSLMNNA